MPKPNSIQSLVAEARLLQERSIRAVARKWQRRYAETRWVKGKDPQDRAAAREVVKSGEFWKRSPKDKEMAAERNRNVLYRAKEATKPYGGNTPLTARVKNRQYDRIRRHVEKRDRRET